VQAAQANWFTVYTKPRQELPLAVNPYQRRSERNLRIEPLFPRYLFLNAVAGQQSLGPVRSTRGVCNLIRFGKRIATVPPRMMDAIKNRLDPATGLVQLDPVPVDVGDRVKVFDGPFAGIEGIFRERKGVARALLLVEMLGTRSTVEVDALLLKKAG
jgi:transcriptional antiterminator RfaH